MTRVYTALALQNLAQAVEQIVERENSFQREQDVLLNHVARRVDSLHRMVESQHRALNGRLSQLAGNGDDSSRSRSKRRRPRKKGRTRAASP